MTHDTEFLRELGRVPELPPDLYSGVRKRIEHSRTMRRALLGIAATFFLALGATAFFFAGQQETTSLAGAAEVAGELQTVRDYLNGSDLAEELQVYALYSEE